jgi:hypothetical protein
MTIKCRKGIRTHLLYFTTTFTNDEITNLQDQSYDMKCHLKLFTGVLTNYTLQDIQLKQFIGEDLDLKIIYRHNDNPEQILKFYVYLTPEGNYKSFYILLDAKKTYADTNFRKNICANVEEIINSILNRQKGEHCDTCIHKYKLNLTRNCPDLYKRNMCKSDFEL